MGPLVCSLGECFESVLLDFLNGRDVFLGLEFLLREGKMPPFLFEFYFYHGSYYFHHMILLYLFPEFYCMFYCPEMCVFFLLLYTCFSLLYVKFQCRGLYVYEKL